MLSIRVLIVSVDSYVPVSEKWNLGGGKVGLGCRFGD